MAGGAAVMPRTGFAAGALLLLRMVCVCCWTSGGVFSGAAPDADEPGGRFFFSFFCWVLICGGSDVVQAFTMIWICFFL